MRKLLTVLLLLSQILVLAQVNPNYHRVKGYYRKDGTYVRPHYRTNPNSTNRDNYSTLGNTNPHTGKPGWIKPDNKPLPSYSKSRSNSYLSPLNYRNSYSTYSQVESGEKTVHYSNGKEIFNLSGETKTDFQPHLTYYYYYYDPSLNMVVDGEGQASGYLLEGNYKFYDEHGTLKINENYLDGLKHGISILYNENGKKSHQETYRYGQLEVIEIISKDGNKMVWDDNPSKIGATRNTYNNSNQLVEKLINLPNDLLEVSVYNEQNGKLEGVYRIKDSFFDGPYTEYHEDGKTRKESGEYRNGEKTGLVTLYDEDGNTYLELSYEDGNQSGPYTFRGDAFIVNGFLKNGEPEGKASKYNFEGELIGIDHFKNGQKHGEHSEFKDGRLAVKGLYAFGKKQGLWEYYYQGEEKADYFRYQYFNFENDVLEGDFQAFSGDSLIVGKYHQGKRQGEVGIFRPLITLLTGVPTRGPDPEHIWASGFYLAGQRHGYWKHYDFKRNLIAEGKYQNGKKEGEWKYYYPLYFENGGGENPKAGELYSIVNYKKGKEDGKSSRYSRIVKIPKICKDDVLRDTCYTFQIKKMPSTSFYKNGELNGLFELQDSLGNLIQKGIYKRGQKDGIWIENTEDQRNEVSFKNGVFHGGFRIYNKNGNLTQSGMLRNGTPTGIWYEYYPDSRQRLRKKMTYHEVGRSIEFFRLDNTRLFLATFQDSIVERITLFEEDGLAIRKTFTVEWIKHNSIGLSISSFNRDTVCTEQQIILTDYPEICSSPEVLLAQFGENPEMNKLIDLKIVQDGDYELKNAQTGQLLVKGQYENGAKVGLWQKILPDHGVRQEITYGENGFVDQEMFKDQRTGRSISRKIVLPNPNGGEELITIKKGIRHGKTTVYDPLSRVKEIRKYKKGVLVN